MRKSPYTTDLVSSVSVHWFSPCLSMAALSSYSYCDGSSAAVRRDLNDVLILDRC